MKNSEEVFLSALEYRYCWCLSTIPEYYYQGRLLDELWDAAGNMSMTIH